MEQDFSFGIVILAAGNSSRLGEPKQLLHFQGSSLIKNVTKAALHLCPDAVTIVTGAYDREIRSELKDLPIDFAHNAHWQTGMGSSIRTGISKMLSRRPHLDGIILAVSDQPFVSTQTFENLIQRTAKHIPGIVASSYDGITGTPAFFSKKYFHALLSLNDTGGAKKLFKDYQQNVTLVPFQLGGIDIDTREDYENLGAM